MAPFNSDFEQGVWGSWKQGLLQKHQLSCKFACRQGNRTSFNANFFFSNFKRLSDEEGDEDKISWKSAWNPVKSHLQWKICRVAHKKRFVPWLSKDGCPLGVLRRGFVWEKAVLQKWEKGVIMQIQDFPNKSYSSYSQVCNLLNWFHFFWKFSRSDTPCGF